MPEHRFVVIPAGNLLLPLPALAAALAFVVIPQGSAIALPLLVAPKASNPKTMPTLDELNASFGLPGVLTFEPHGQLIRAQVTTLACTATIYLHGAHLTAWQPTGHQPVIFLSAASDFAPGKPIRGGIPICFPWFGPRSDGRPGPSHGFARLDDWTVAFAALSGEDLHLTLTLGPTDLSRSLGFNGFRCAYELTLGRTLTARFTVANLNDRATGPIEEALHAYFAVGDVRRTSLSGLQSAEFIDKTDAFKRKQTPPTPLKLTAETDRVFPANAHLVDIDDRALSRRIKIRKSNSQTTVIWNPWSTGAAKLPDLPDDAWPHFVCVEAANSGADAFRLAPNEAHAMELCVSVSAMELAE